MKDQKNKIVSISPLQPDTLRLYEGEIVYLPQLDTENILFENWKELVDQYQPTTVIFYTARMDEEMLKYWREKMPEAELKIIRRGTSLARCAVKVADCLRIEVENTPGVNSPFVANYMSDFLFTKDMVATNCAIIGVGEIGRRVASRAVADTSLNLKLFSRRLANSETRLNKLEELNLSIDRVSCPETLLETFKGSNFIAISLPLSPETKNIITPEMIKAIPLNSKLVIVSPYGVFSEEALRALHARADIEVEIDNVATSFPRIKEIIGSRELRPGFTLSPTKAVESPECQTAMDKAVMEKMFSKTKFVDLVVSRARSPSRSI